MFQNRVRTAALAGAIAVATGVSGLTVPANAEIKQNVSDQFIDPNASTNHLGTAVNPIPEVKQGEVTAEKVLRERVGDVQEWVSENYSPDQIKDYRNKAEFDNEAEEALAANAAANRDAVSVELAVASQNLRDVLATIDQAEREAKEAQNAWTAWASAVTLTESEAKKINKFIDDNNLGVAHVTGNQYSPKQADFYNNTKTLAADLNNYREGLAQRIQNASADSATADEKANAAKLAELDAKIESYLDGNAEALRTNAVEKSKNLQKYDISALEDIKEQAEAQVRVLRLLQSYYAVAARYYEQYQNSTLTQDERQTLRQTYRLLLDGEKVAPQQGAMYPFEYNGLQHMVGFTRSAVDGLLDNHYEVIADSKWDLSVDYVFNLDKKYESDAEAAAAADAARKAEEEARKQNDKAIRDALDAIAAALAAEKGTQPSGNSDTNQGNGTSNQGNDSSSTDSSKKDGKKLSTGAIIGIVLGVIAALGGVVAFAFPQIQQFLP